jgi:dTDP-4-amino-4,6-dideoxygalactose transaminase
MTETGVPFLDLVTPHRDLRDELHAVLDAALDSARFVHGPMVEGFERAFAEFCETRFCVGMSNGTDALRLALIAAGVRPGDTVVTVPLTFIATAEAISQAGARLELVDVDERTYTMDPERLRTFLEEDCDREPGTGRLVSKRTGTPVTAIVPVHLYGQVADMDGITDLAARHGLIVVEDACQAHGAEYFQRKEDRWYKAGSVGQAAAFSFYPGKNLGACGEAGAVTTNDEQVAERCKRLRDHGQTAKYYHDVEGYNARLDAIQAGFLHVKLRHLAKWNELRRRAAAVYDEAFADGEGLIVRPEVPWWSRPVYHLYVVRVAARERVERQLAAAGIGTGVHYPTPLHLLPPYRHLGFKEGEFPVAEQTASQVLSLPMYPGISPLQQGRVVRHTLEAVRTLATSFRTEAATALGERR